MARLACGDEGALATMLHDHWPDLVAYGTHLLGSPDQAQDLAQEAFVRLWERRGDWQPNSTPRPILFRILRNLALDERRALLVRARCGPAIAAVGPAVVRPVGTDRVEAAELQAAIDDALRRLSEREREVVVLSRFHDLARAEIASITGLAPRTVSNLLSVAMARLARILSPRLEAADGGLTRRMLRRA